MKAKPRQPETAVQWHALQAEEAVAAAQSDSTSGLSRQVVEERLARFGPNALAERGQRSLFAVFVHQFRSPLIYLLLLASAVAFAVGKRGDAAVIAIVVLLNALIGAFQEGRAERSLQALRRLAGQQARVLRDGREQLVEARDLVPGDVLLLAAGDAVAADARVFDGASLQTAEAALTGESLPVAKEVRPVAPDTSLADRRNMVYAGTHVAAGRARAVVVATGPATEIGRIAELAEAGKEPKTPLERRVEQFGRYILIAAGLMFVAINALGLLRGIAFAQIVMVALSQVVSMIPEGLPVAMTIALSVGVQRMARRRTIVRRLAAVETLGSTTVICSDKTGTLTRGEMTVTSIYLPEDREIGVSGSGYAPQGEFSLSGAGVDPGDNAGLQALLSAGLLCNDSELLAPDDSDPRWRALGDPTEAALLTVAVKGGLVPAQLRAEFPRRAEIPFDSGTKMMATQHESGTASTVFVKGAPEVVLDLCAAVRVDTGLEPLDDLHRRRIQAAAERMAARALRVLAIAEAPGAEIDGHLGFEGLRGRVHLLGLVGQMDPPRTEASEAVRSCRLAGIRPVMVTGDHKVTALAVARALGIAQEGDVAVETREVEQLSDAALVERIETISVFARVHPAQKLRIVQAWQQRGAVVAMTGDGVNDAPALARADVGVAMGLTGTEVAKEAAAIVVTDDNFATIISAVEEGRVVYRNIKRVVLYLFSTSVAEVLVLMVALVAGYPPPLAAVQILWINLVTEGTVTINLIMEPAEGDEMRRRPISPREPLVTRELLRRMAFMTPTIAAVTLGWFVHRLSAGVAFPQAQTEAFTALAVCQWFNVLNCRSATRSALSLSLFRNPWLVGGLVLGNLLQAAVVFWPPLNAMFHTVPIDPREVVFIGLVSSLVLWVEEIRKLIGRVRARREVLA